MNDSTTNNKIGSLKTLNSTLPDLYHADWLDTVPIQKGDFGKPVDLLQWFGLLHDGNWILKRLVFSYHLLPLLVMFNVTQLNVWNYFESKDKMRWQLKPKKYRDGNSFIRGFWFYPKTQLLPLLDITFVSNWPNYIYSLFLVSG